MQIILDIPISEIPKHQDILEVPLHFIDGKVCEAGGYDFDVLSERHGRIGDLDQILTWMIYKKGIIDELKCGEIAHVFKDATIIEADEGVNKNEIS